MHRPRDFLRGWAMSDNFSELSRGWLREDLFSYGDKIHRIFWILSGIGSKRVTKATEIACNTTGKAHLPPPQANRQSKENIFNYRS